MRESSIYRLLLMSYFYSIWSSSFSSFDIHFWKSFYEFFFGTGLLGSGVLLLLAAFEMGYCLTSFAYLVLFSTINLRLGSFLSFLSDSCDLVKILVGLLINHFIVILWRICLQSFQDLRVSWLHFSI